MNGKNVPARTGREAFVWAVIHWTKAVFCEEALRNPLAPPREEERRRLQASITRYRAQAADQELRGFAIGTQQEQQEYKRELHARGLDRQGAR